MLPFSISTESDAYKRELSVVGLSVSEISILIV